MTDEHNAPGTTGVLVVGGGISGLTAALEAAEVGNDVFLIEKNPYLGGRVAQLNQYFPKLWLGDQFSTAQRQSADSDLSDDRGEELFRQSRRLHGDPGNQGAVCEQQLHRLQRLR